jgi:5'-nucleotidase
MSVISNSVDLPLIIGVSTRAMFDLTEEHSVFEREGVEAYAALQRQRENDPLKPGAAFEVTRRLLALNPGTGNPLVEVILLSRNSPDLSLRAFRAFEDHKIQIKRGASRAVDRLPRS